MFAGLTKVRLFHRCLVLLIITRWTYLSTDSQPPDSLLVVSGWSVVTQEELQHQLQPTHCRRQASLSEKPLFDRPLPPVSQ